MDLSNPISAIVPSLEGSVLQVLARTASPLSGSRIAELTGAGSNPGVRSALARLVKQGTVASTRSGPSILYSANREHLIWPAIEVAVSAADVALETLGAHIVELTRREVGARLAGQITLAWFGSVARGTSTRESDIDVVAVLPDELETDVASSFVESLTSSVRRWTGNTCNVFEVSNARLGELVAAHDPMIAAWVADSRTLMGADLRNRIGRI